MEAKKRKRLSILARISILFSVAILLSLGVAVLISDKYMTQNAVDQAKEVANVAALTVEIALGSEDAIERLKTDDMYKMAVQLSFRFLCENANLKYVYLYTLEEGNARRYLAVAAKDDAENTKLLEEFGAGQLSYTPLHQCEINVINGDTDGDHEFVDNEYGKVCMFVVPVLDWDGNIKALIGVDYSLDSIIDIARSNRRRQMMYIFIVIGFASVIAYILIRTLVVKPIGKLSKRMEEFARDKTIGSGGGKRRSVFDDEVTDIERSFDIMTTDITTYINDIERLTGEKVQTQTELEVAKNIQYGIVPKEHCLMGNGYDVFGCEYSARDVGGDFYDIFELDDRRVCFVAGDISGKGISAALFMVMVKTALREKLKVGYSLKDTLIGLNHDMCISNPENLFSTVFCGVLDKTSGLLRYANAGHNPPVLMGEDPSFINVDSGMALGLFDDIEIEEMELYLKKGEGVLVYTDGITEAINSEKIQYGEDRLIENIKKSRSKNEAQATAKDIASDVVASVREFAGSEEQFDDITCVAVIFCGNTGDENEIKNGIKPELSAFEPIKNNMLDLLGNSDKTREKILACEEMFVNIVSYSGADNVRYTCEFKGDMYAVTFSDNGVPFDPVNYEVKEKDFEELDMGGMGISLARLNSSEMSYSRDNDRNVLTMKFVV